MHDTGHADKDRQYHDVIADEYHRIVVDPRKLTNDVLFRSLLPREESIDSYLDLGCGTGHVLERIRSKLNPKNITAVDHSKGMLSQIERLPHFCVNDSLRIVHDDIMHFLQSSTGNFNLISCVGVLHHLRISTIDTVLSACRQRLHPGGYLLVAEPVESHTLKHPPGWVIRRNSRSPAADLSYSKVAEEPDEHPLPEGLLEQALVRSGFTVVRQRRTVEIFPLEDPPSLFDWIAACMASLLYRKSGFVHAVLAKSL